jgi:hypothetical protein
MTTSLPADFKAVFLESFQQSCRNADLTVNIEQICARLENVFSESDFFSLGDAEIHETLARRMAGVLIAFGIPQFNPNVKGASKYLSKLNEIRNRLSAIVPDRVSPNLEDCYFFSLQSQKAIVSLINALDVDCVDLHKQIEEIDVKDRIRLRTSWRESCANMAMLATELFMEAIAPKHHDSKIILNEPDGVTLFEARDAGIKFIATPLRLAVALLWCIGIDNIDTYKLRTWRADNREAISQIRKQKLDSDPPASEAKPL